MAKTNGEKRSFSRRAFVKGVSATVAAGGLLSRVQQAASSPSLVVGPHAAKQIKIGVVGGGFGSRFYWHLHPNSKVTAVCDLRDDRLKSMSETFRCTETFKDFRSFLKKGDMDAVAVFTPAPLHAWMATEAMKAGKHVISAVPAGMSVEECEQLIDCVHQTGLRYMMAETSYYRPEVITCREWAREGKFGTIFYSEAEYHHEGLIPLMYDDRQLPTWRLGFPPMHYPTHCTGIVIPVTGERLIEVQATGWGDGHEVLQTNPYENPFWNTVGFFKTSGGHSCRIAVFWHVAGAETERGDFYGDRMSYHMRRPEGMPNTVARISQNGQTVLDENGYPQGDVQYEKHEQATFWERLPPELRIPSGHGGSHTFLTHEFVSALVEERNPAIDVYESVAYTVPGIVAHQSALKHGEAMKIRDYGRAKT
jgi:predicted dehydrogenase